MDANKGAVKRGPLRLLTVCGCNEFLARGEA